MKFVKAAPLLLHVKVSDEGVKPEAIQATVTVFPTPEPHGIEGNTVGPVIVATKGRSK